MDTSINIANFDPIHTTYLREHKAFIWRHTNVMCNADSSRFFTALFPI